MEIDTPIEDSNPFLDEPPQEAPLPYDDVPETENGSTSKLASRIGAGRVYLLSESSASLYGRIGGKKRKSANMDEEIEEDRSAAPEEGDVTGDSSMRDNAITLQGTPISQLATAKVFAYAAQFHKTPPMGLEWVDDNTVVLIYKTSAQARLAFESLVEDAEQTPNEFGQYNAHNVPIELWPPQARVEKLLVKGGGLEGEIFLRWATVDDVKKKGAAHTSTFYKKYGGDAGREGRPRVDIPGEPSKRQRGERGWSKETEEERRARLDRELDNIGSHTEDASDSAPKGDRKPLGNRIGGRRGERRGAGREKGRPAASKDDLDAELDSFLKDREG